jgi:hydroxymethylglutaryl-CoA lyase
MVLDAMPDPKLHIAHFHETKRLASANILAALQAGIENFEATMGGIGGPPATFVDDCPCGIGEPYYKDDRYVGLVCLEDTLVQLDEMGIEHGLDVDRILQLGILLEKTLGRRLRSEAVVNGRTQKIGHPEFSRPELFKLKEKLGEIAGQRFPRGWSGTI